MNTSCIQDIAAGVNNDAYTTGAWLGRRLREEDQPNHSDYLFACDPKRLTKDELKAMTDAELMPHLRRAADYRRKWGDHEYGRILSEAARRLVPGTTFQFPPQPVIGR